MIGIWGANGFIGRNLVHHVIQAGDLKDLLLYARDFSDFPFPLPSETQAISGDFLQDEGGAHRASECDILILLITASHIRTFLSDPQKELEGNILPYRNLFVALRKQKKKPRQIIYLSSGGAIYGDIGTVPVPETHEPHPNTPYGMAKKNIEKMVEDFCLETKCRYTILRVANPVGLWSKKKSLVPVILEAAKTGEAVSVFGDGTSVRDYFDVRDLSRAIYQSIDHPLAQNKVFNVGSGVGLSINQVIDIAREKLGISIGLTYQTGPGAVIDYNVLDCKKIHDCLGWYAETPLDETISYMWKQS